MNCFDQKDAPRIIGGLRLRMIEDMKARQLNRHTQRSYIYSCKRFAAYLKRSPETAEDIRNLQLGMTAELARADLVDHALTQRLDHGHGHKKTPE
jgi:hypothetical protein